MASSLLRHALGMLLLGTAITGCAADVDDEDVGVDEAEIKKSPDGALQIYTMNTHHMSEPGKDSFEVTDWRQMLSYMREQAYHPDIILLSEVGRNNSVPSQPCVTFVRGLQKALSPKGKIEWNCEQAKGHVTKLDNAGGGTAIVYRKNLVPQEKVVLVQWSLDKSSGKCVPDQTGPGLSLIQVFKDGKRRVAVASLHLVSGTTEGATNQLGRDCSEKSLRDVTEAMAKIDADVKIIGGDMNHADAARRVEGTNIIHEQWEGGYAETCGYLAKGQKYNAGFKDPWFRDCAASCSVKASGDTSYTAAQTQCISSCMGKALGPGRIDWTLAKGGQIDDNVLIEYADARAAYVRQTGDANAVEKYADHRANRMLIKY